MKDKIKKNMFQSRNKADRDKTYPISSYSVRAIEGTNHLPCFSDADLEICIQGCGITIEST